MAKKLYLHNRFKPVDTCDIVLKYVNAVPNVVYPDEGRKNNNTSF